MKEVNKILKDKEIQDNYPGQYFYLLRNCIYNDNEKVFVKLMNFFYEIWVGLCIMAIKDEVYITSSVNIYNWLSKHNL